MKKIFLIAAISASLIACKEDDKKTSMVTNPTTSGETKGIDSANLTSITWLDSTNLNLGTIKKGKTVEVSFRFKNTGDKPLIIADVTAGCGCTIPEKPEEPFAPGQEGVIKAKFESKNQSVGPHEKPVYVTTNTSTPNPIILNFKVDIID